LFEDVGSSLLWRFFDSSFLSELEEGITEPAFEGSGNVTNWRKPSEYWRKNLSPIPGTFIHKK
jgi:hypothetical protein